MGKGPCVSRRLASFSGVTAAAAARAKGEFVLSGPAEEDDDEETVRGGLWEWERERPEGVLCEFRGGVGIEAADLSDVGKDGSCC